MNKGWREVTIDDIKADSKNAIAMGPFGSRIKAENFVKKGVPVIKGQNLNGDFILEDQFDFLTEEKADELKSSHAFRGDIVITHRGTIGQVGLIPENSKYRKYVVSQSQLKISLDLELASPKFIYYYLRSKIGQYYLLMNSSQVGVPAIARASSSIKSIRVNLPPLQEQKAIAHILGTLDDKIELNRQMNKSLEEMAQALFQSWFVDFDPVIDNALKAGNEIPETLAQKAEKRKTVLAHSDLPTLPEEIQALFPSSFTYNETLAKWIPEGWEVKSLGGISEVISKGTTPRKGDVEGKEETIPFIKVRDIDDLGNVSTELDLIPEEVHVKQLKRSILKTNDLLFSIAGTIGRVAVVSDKLNYSNCNQAVAFIRLKDINEHKILVHQNLRSERIQNIISSKVVQAVQANASLRNISDLTIICPSISLLDQFNNSMIDFYDKLDVNKEEIESLTQLRDTLLPQLISGKLSVPEAMLAVKALD